MKAQENIGRLKVEFRSGRSGRDVLLAQKPRPTTRFSGAKYSKLFHIISKIDSDNDFFADPSRYFFFTLILAQFYCW